MKIILAILLLPLTASAGMLLIENWESKSELVQWYRSGSDKTVLATTPSRNGQSLCFTVEAGSNRTELVPRGEKNKGIETFNLGQEYWFGFSIYIPIDTPDGHEFVVWQIHGVPKDWNNSRNPPVALLYADGDWRFNVGSAQENAQRTVTKAYLGPANKGAWTDFIIQMFMSYEDDGITRVHVDGYGGKAQRLSRQGGNAYNDSQGGYMKMGIYHMGGNTNVPIKVCNDEIRVGTGKYMNSTITPRGFR